MSYKERLLRETAIRMQAGLMKPGAVTMVHVAHDDWCAIYKGGECNCDPEISYEPVDLNDDPQASE